MQLNVIEDVPVILATRVLSQRLDIELGLKRLKGMTDEC